jgi:SagB-type dehydrogenase family enzyme
VLGRLLQFAHGVTHDGHGGPIPSSGGLQALELYLAILENDWLPAGAYHFDRQGHCLAQLASCTSRPQWLALVPSLCHVEGGSVLWVIVGDGARIRAKYGERGLRFLLLEAGHLMQDLCLLSASLELCTVPLGGFLEKDIGRVLTLPPADQVLYVGVCGEVSGR